MTDIVLVPGLWLDGPSWSRVATRLDGAGHRVWAVTLPGMESAQADRSAITLADHVAAVVAAIDACANSPIVVGHSAGCAVVHAASDARPDRVLRAVYIGGFPTPDGVPIVDGFRAVGADIPLPDFSEFDDADLIGLSDADLAEFRARAIPSPALLLTDRQRLSNPARYRVPVTAVATEYTCADLKAWIAAGAEPVSEFTHIDDVEYVDLPTGHWPQFSRPDDLADLIIKSTRPSTD